MSRRRGVLHALACVVAFDHYLAGTIVGTLTPDQLAAVMEVFRKTPVQGAEGARVPFKAPA